MIFYVFYAYAQDNKKKNVGDMLSLDEDFDGEGEGKEQGENHDEYTAEIDMELKDEDKDNNSDDSDDDEVFLDAIDNMYYEKLEYCILMIKWAAFSVKNKHLIPLNKFIIFCQEQLKKLDKYMSSKRLNIKCIALLREKNSIMKSLIKDSMPWFNKKSRINTLNSMVKQYETWSNLKAWFITFLTKYTKQDEDAVTAETKNFVNFLKNWDMASYKTVKRRREWKQLLTNNNADVKLEFLSEMQENGVFLSIWYYERRQIITEWKYADYIKMLYRNAKKSWDNLTTRIKKKKLTYEDRKWFKDLDLVKELNKMNIDKKAIDEIKRDMDHSIKLDLYIPFVINLTKIVEIFIKCDTKIKNNKDGNWNNLLQTLSLSKSKRNNQSQDIAEAAKLYRDMESSINAHFDKLHKDWIASVVSCDNSVIRMATDEEFKDEFFIETLTLLDDSNDGELTQLSGALRSVQKKFKGIWEGQFKTKSVLMRYFASIPLKQNDINNILQVHDGMLLLFCLYIHSVMNM